MNAPKVATKQTIAIRPARDTLTPEAMNETEHRAGIVRQLTELHGSISVQVGHEEGGPVGRVLEHAGSLYARCLIDFASDNAAEARGHGDAVEAESFVMAAAALADQEKRTKTRDAGSAAAVARMAREADAICNALDRFNMGRREAGAATANPAEADADPDDSLDFGKDADRVALVLDASYQIETLAQLLLHMGDLAHEEATALYLPNVVKTMGVRIEALNSAIMSAVSDPLQIGFDGAKHAVHGCSAGLVISRVMVPA